MNTLELYKKYLVYDFLQIHHLRVAAVTKMITDSYDYKINKEDILKAALVHDIGKIAEMKVGIIPGSVKNEEDLNYWKSVQVIFRQRYGDSNDAATVGIMKELKMSPEIISIVQRTGFKHAKRNFDELFIEGIITTYADQRVTPYGVATLEYRIEEGRVHYHADNKIKHNDYDEWKQLSEYCYKIEEFLFNKNKKIKPSDITEDSIKPIISELKKYEI